MSSRVLRSGAGGAQVPDGQAAPVAFEKMVWRRPAGAGGPMPGGRRLAEGAADAGQAAEREKEIEARVAASYKQGFAAGEAAGAQRAGAKLEPAVAAFGSMVNELAGLQRRFRAEAEEATVALAVAIARRVLHRELATDPEAILGLVKAAFQRCDARESHRLRISPLDAEMVRQNREALALPPALEIVSDAGLMRGSAIFETSRGELDASVGTQLAEIERGFADALAKRRAPQ
ncbi:MAG TPA: FliH/SctL family protein [Bryobacteraceae bacterium]|nr:FliH/SctL family protein [Bryobacteraceae bacterium]